LFPVLGPQPGQSETTIKEEEDRKDYFDLFGKILERRTYKDIDAQEKVESNYDEAEIFDKILHRTTG
jgi:hypothetical protein